MNAFVERLAGWMTSRSVPDLLRCALWLGLGLIFLVFAAQAYSGMKTTLPRTGFRLGVAKPPRTGSATLDLFVDRLAESHDRTVQQLEVSIRQTSRRQFWISLAAALLSLLGLGVHASVWKWQTVQPEDPKSSPLSPRPTSMLRRRRPRDPPPPPVHEGSFPEGGYTH